MKITEAIKQLQECLNEGETDIVFAYWARDMFQVDNKIVDKETFAGYAEDVEDNMDWSYAWEDMMEIIARDVAEDME